MKSKSIKPLRNKSRVKKAKHKMPPEALAYLYDKAVEVGVYLALDFIYPCHDKKVLNDMARQILEVKS